MRVLGLMSGTSADGIDAVLVDFKGDPSKPKWKILNTCSYEYPSSTREKIIQVGQGLKISSKHTKKVSIANGLAPRKISPKETLSSSIDALIA